MYQIKRSAEEINDILNKVVEQEENGGSKWPGMTYEQGVAAALHWVFGNCDANPMDD